MNSSSSIRIASIVAALALTMAHLFEATAAAAPPPPPGTLTAEVISYSQVDLTWANESYGPSDFKVERDSGSGFAEITTVSSSGSEYPVALGGKAGLSLSGSPSNVCSYDARESDEGFGLVCGSSIAEPTVASSGSLSCSGPGWNSIPALLWPPSGLSSGTCTPFSTAPNPYPWTAVITPTTASTALQDDAFGNCSLTAADVAAISPGLYKCANLVLGPLGGETLCTSTSVDAVDFVGIYVSGALSFGNNARVNVKYSTGGCSGEAAGPAVGGGSYAPTESPAAFRVFKSSSGEIDIRSGSNLPKVAMTLYAPSSWADCSGAPAFAMFGAILLNSLSINGCINVLAHDRSLLAGSVVQYSDSGLAPGTQYRYRVKATNGDGDSTYSNEVVVTTLGSLSGHIAGGTWGSISVYDAAGQLVSYECCMTSEFWQANPPASSCPAGGYKVLWLPPDNSKSPSWLGPGQTYGDAACISAPSMNNDMTATVKPYLSGYVKDKETAADIDGAYIYAFDAGSGNFVGWSRSGSDGSGRFSLSLPAGGPYRVKVMPPAGYTGQWYSGAMNFTEASPVVAPKSDVDFSVETASPVEGYVKDAATAADLNGYPVYAYSAAGKLVGYGVTDRGAGQGRFRIDLPPYEAIKLLAGGGGVYANQWYSGSTSFTEASATSPPFTANFALSP